MAGFALIRICRTFSLEQQLRAADPWALCVSAKKSSATGGNFVWTSSAAWIGAGSVLSQGLAICARPSFDIHRLQPMLGKSFTLQHPGSSGCPYYSHSRTLPSSCLLVHVACERTIMNICYVECLSSLAAFRVVDDCDCARLDVVYHSESNWLWMNHKPLFPVYRTATGQKK